jgi:signal transduction histidine kinase
LQSIFVDERDDALRAVAQRQDALRQYAEKELAQALAQRLAQAEPGMSEALVDPLLPAKHLLVIDNGEQRLPRLATNSSRSDTPAKGLFERLLARYDAGTTAEDAAGAEEDGYASPLQERLVLFNGLIRALRSGDRSGIERSVRAMLGHRAQFVLATEEDIPIVLASLELLTKHSSPARELMKGLLREGIPFGGRQPGQARGQLSGLQRDLLSNKQRLSAEDFRFLTQRITALSERSGVLWSDFADRAAEGPGPTVAVADELSEATLLDAGRWYVEPKGGGRVRGITVDVSDLLAEITSAMKERGLLEASDRIESTLQPTQPLSALELAVQSPRWDVLRNKAADRHQLKTALGGATGVLCLGILVLGWMVYRRRHRFVELKSGFVSAVSHELRTPLASIRLMAETLERRTRKLPEARDYPTRIIRDVDGLSLLVENILSFDRLSRGRWTAKLSPVRVADVVEKIESDTVATSQRAVEIETEGIDGLELVADGDLLHLLLANLVKNGCHYNTRAPIQIGIRGRAREDGSTLLRVTDNGVGIPPDETERVFEDFYRSSPRTEQAVRGSGLGLAICRKIMEAHHGTIRVAETSERGTTFEMEFPRAQAPRSEA